MGRFKVSVALAGIACSFVLVSSAAAASIPNGNFEKGDLTGWTTTNSPDSVWEVYGPGSITFPSFPYAPSAKGQFSLTLITYGPSWGVISRVIKVPTKARKLQMSLWWDNQSSGGWKPIDDWTSLSAERQDLGIDLIPAGASAASPKTVKTILDPRSTSPARSGNMSPAAWVPVSVDVRQLRGKKVKLRMVQISNVSYLYLGVDDIRFSG